ncbi:MAG TPA: NAD-dependent epimerase/dehydratase family protein [Acidobacteriota bacterium]|nr:NAD-dependent epimerase/dehydratase family protein [Acidobacteriota bacterium]
MALHFETEEQLEDVLSTPTAADTETMRLIAGDIMVLGAGGKMGPSLARLARRASDQVGIRRRVIAVSRFSQPAARRELERAGVDTVEVDLLDQGSISQLPRCQNLLYLAGRKFGSTDRPDVTWAINTLVPAFVAQHFSVSRIVAFSTGNVYPLVPLSSGGSVETDPMDPVGEYAQSCVGRERIFDYYSRQNGTQVLFYRLNYAMDLRYGVLVDIARRIHEGVPVPLTVSRFNTIWQGDANSYALRSLALCQSPPAVLNITGPEIISVRQAALFFAGRFGREAFFSGEETDKALLSNAARCHSLLGPPKVTAAQLMEWVACWIEAGGVSLQKPTHFEVSDGKF